MPDKKATITDIAMAAGVSKTTVSRYINGRYDLLSEATRKRIEKAIQIAHYRPSAVARSLKTQRSYLVGVIVANITTPFATSLLNGISSGLMKSGYIPIFGDAADSPDTEHALIDSLTSHQVDGLIVNTTTSKNPELIALANTGTPVVLCDRYVRNYDFDIAVSAYMAPTRELMEHLHEQGFDRAVLLTQEYENNSPRQFRYDAFTEADAELFGSADPEADVFVASPWEPETMREAVRAICETTPAGKRCAIYATNTVTLIAAYNAIEDAGLKVPDDLGLCGPDDWGWAHRMGWNWPSMLNGGITTFATNPYDMGFAAAELMVQRISDPNGEKRHVEIPTKLEIRGSTLLKDRKA